MRSVLTSSSFRVNNSRENHKTIVKDDAGYESQHELSLRVKKSRWFGKINWSYRFRSREDRRREDDSVAPFRSRHPSLGFDTEAVYVNLGVAGGVKFSNLDSIGFHSSASKFQYETSDTTNPQRSRSKPVASDACAFA